MGKKDARIDDYIGKSPEFARPILKHLRRLVHAACPDAEETLKWGLPHFVHKGNLCHMAAFKQHCAFGFWKRALMVDEVARGREKGAMGQFGRVTALSDLPANRVLTGYIKQAVKLNDDGVTRPSRPASAAKKKIVVPAYFKAALEKNKRALAAFEGFSPSHKREYVEWITEAKREETRQARVKMALEWLAQGKPRNWKYMKKT